MRGDLKMKCQNDDIFRITSICLTILFFGLIIASNIHVAKAGKYSNITGVNITNSSPTIAEASLNPAFIAYINSKHVVTSRVSEVHGKGLIPTPVDLSHVSPTSSAAVSFPATYDLRALNKVTPIKNQGTAGVCWAFATYGSLESYLKPTDMDFSENNMKNVLSSASPQGFDRGPQDGGQILESTAYLARWSGPVKTSDDPYSDTSSFISAELEMPIQQHVQNVYYLPTRKSPTDNDQIKSAIQTYGGVYTTYNHDFAPQYYNGATHSYYKNVSTTINHALTIVGWDDNYNKHNFTIVPPDNGAFIVKNSWDTNWGENGYFYISYYDASFGYDSNAVFTSENTNNYKNIYQYDPLGWCNNWGSGTNPTCWGANVFTATSNGLLEAVSFYTTDSNCNYNLYIGSSNLASRTLVQSGNILLAGYHTISLDSPVSLTAGQKFSTIVKLTFPNPNPANSNDYYPMVTEEPIAGYSSKVIANASESFLSLDGSTWRDMITLNPNTNLCIKAFTGSSVSSTNDNLAGLTISSGTLSPIFFSSTTIYTDSVANNVSNITVTPTTQDITATIKVNGIAVTSGQVSQPINLKVGTNTIKVIVTAQSGATKTYTFRVTRAAASTNDNLADLTISSGTLSPKFSSRTTTYSVTNSISSITATPTTQDITATIKVNGIAVISGQVSQPINLKVGTNTIKVIVTAQSGATKAYTITGSVAKNIIK
jgi:C1A family cysteine protease